MRTLLSAVLGWIAAQDGAVRIEAPVAANYLPADDGAYESPVRSVEKLPAVEGVSDKLAFGRSAMWGVRDSAKVTDGRTVLFESAGIGGVAFDGEDLWVVDSAKVARIGPDGKSSRSFASPTKAPRGLAVVGDRLVVADQQKLFFMSREGRLLDSNRAPSGDLTDLAGHGNLLLAAEGQGKALHVLSANGWVVLSIPLEFAPVGVASDGRSITAAGASERAGVVLDAARKLTLGEKQCARIRFQGSAPGLLALPWNMNRQKIVGGIAADSDRIRKDRWGQPAVESGSISFSAEIFDVLYTLWPDAVKGEVPAEIKRAYLADGDKLKISDPLIQEARRWVTRDGKEKNPYELLHRAYAYTTDKIYYARGGGWPDAPTALGRGTGTCSPISFVFVAVCRASGVPARFQAGTRFRGNPRDEEFHRWCEVFLPGYGWIPADPSGCGKNPAPAHRARFLGHVPNIDLILTLGGGGSEFFGWGYNSQKGGAAIWSDMRKEKPK